LACGLALAICGGSPQNMNSVAIVGVGLIGGSFASAIRHAGFRGEIVGVSSPSTIENAVGFSIIDRGVTLEEASACDLVFLAQAIGGIEESLSRLHTSSVVTDAGSTKRAICQAARHLPHFVGGHPMAGKEQRGVEHSDPDLFKGRPWLLTSEPPEALRRLLGGIGAQVMVTTPEEHDRLVALASHLPQIVSNALYAATAPARPFSGPGLESMTRLARSPFAIWQDILATNRDEILTSLDSFLATLTAFRESLAQGEDREVFPRD
jgi:prephenate dehydrogenase